MPQRCETRRITRISGWRKYAHWHNDQPNRFKTEGPYLNLPRRQAKKKEPVGSPFPQRAAKWPPSGSVGNAQRDAQLRKAPIVKTIRQPPFVLSYSFPLAKSPAAVLTHVHRLVFIGQTDHLPVPCQKRGPGRSTARDAPCIPPVSGRLASRWSGDSRFGLERPTRGRV